MAKVASEPKAKGYGTQLSRRDFLRVGGTAAALGTAGFLVADRFIGDAKAEAPTPGKVRYGMVIDLERCFGCRTCMEACKVENNTTRAVFWMYVFRFEEGRYPDMQVRYLPRPCMHCDNAPCVKVCPVGARYKREDGLTATDWDRCIGCRYCQVSCPYSVNYFNWKDPKKNQYLDWKTPEAVEVRQATKGVIPPYKNPDLEERYGKEKRYIAGSGHVKGVMEKCTFCVHRVEKGLMPACVSSCPVGALIFGNLNDPETEASRLLRQKRFFRLEEGLGTEPRVYYVGSPPPGASVRQIEGIIGRV